MCWLILHVVELTNNFFPSIFLVKETPEAFPLPTEASIVEAAAGWAHCVAATGK